ncbi:MauE/DoxX family redox-associated membrane protein [Raineyella fluvialis]|uniref:Methylamine utilisation protein MauE domain-containing protein n=1 Tax=Raineyella fluvialis TaxID=2662261 RepID=A0A5Q2FF25_9ACTN|nr:MauE/DoxX family redox-associated membrane protein [Raineyella fluvialis]QGF24397.1 hypothetical protein Rai3103_12855 [Raineyella fluvialis]
MPDFLVLAPLVVAVTLVVAAVGKWRHPDAGQTAFEGAGLPAWIGSGFVRRWHPVAELVLGLGIVLLPTPWNLLAVLGGAVLVLAYLVLVIIAVRAPGPVSCGCFGAEDTAPVSGRTLARNILLVVAAVIALVDAALGGSVIGRLGSLAVWGWLLGLHWPSPSRCWRRPPVPPGQRSPSRWRSPTWRTTTRNSRTTSARRSPT